MSKQYIAGIKHAIELAEKKYEGVIPKSFIGLLHAEIEESERISEELEILSLKREYETLQRKMVDLEMAMDPEFRKAEKEEELALEAQIDAQYEQYKFEHINGEPNNFDNFSMEYIEEQIADEANEELRDFDKELPF